MTLPADSHVHSEWSWDAGHGSMDRTCARALELGLPRTSSAATCATSQPWSRPTTPSRSSSTSTTPVRSWDEAADGPFDPAAFEVEFRQSLEAVAEAGKVLEINTVLPLHPTVVRWWHDVGGGAVSFGSDAHEPVSLARRCRDARHLAEACGFRPGRDPHDLWSRID